MTDPELLDHMEMMCCRNTYKDLLAGVSGMEVAKRTSTNPAVVARMVQWLPTLIAVLRVIHISNDGGKIDARALWVANASLPERLNEFGICFLLGYPGVSRDRQVLRKWLSALLAVL